MATFGIPKKYNQSVLYIVVAAAIAIGTYLLLHALAYSPVDIAFSPPSHGSIYKAGDPIVFGITNNSGADITLANTAPWTVTDHSGQVVYTSIGADVTMQLVPQEKKFWTWGQTDNSGNQVAAGEYTIKVSYLLGTKPGIISIKVTVH